MEDSLLYKLKAAMYDVMWIEQEIRRSGFESLFPSEAGRTFLRNYVSQVIKSSEFIREKMGKEFHPEF